MHYCGFAAVYGVSAMRLSAITMTFEKTAMPFANSATVLVIITMIIGEFAII